jgi:hypothetical protein
VESKVSDFFPVVYDKITGEAVYRSRSISYQQSRDFLFRIDLSVQNKDRASDRARRQLIIAPWKEAPDNIVLVRERIEREIA